MQRGLAHLLVVAIIAIVIFALAIGILLWRNNQNLAGGMKACPAIAKLCPDGSSVAPTGPDCQIPACPSLKPAATASSSVDTTNWKTYPGSRYSFEYPGNWLLNTDETNNVYLSNPPGSVSMTLSDEESPYGFENPDLQFVDNSLKVVVAGKEYLVTETILNGVSAYVDFHTDSPNVVYVFFGTGYPASSDAKKSLQDYQNSKTDIFKILSSLKFK